MLQHQHHDPNPIETSEWIESLEAVSAVDGKARAEFLLERLLTWAQARQIAIPYIGNTPYINTIHHSEQPEYPGDRKIERRIKNYLRWNAMAMVVRANRAIEGIGGHISTYASLATILEVGFNHYFRGGSETEAADQIFFQGHASPGIYARAYLEGRIDEKHLMNFRRELQPGGGLSSYPHPWLMQNFWEFPTVSMGLGPITSIYMARFNRYLHDRGLKDTSNTRVWAFLGDGEMDEPESLGAITLASREGLDNLTWVVNCNLQRLDGPVRGNGSIIQELEAAFRGAGWNVIKVLFGSDWDPLFDADNEGVLTELAAQTVDGQWQRYSVEDGAYAREHFFGRDPRALKLVENMSDDEIRKMRLGGHDPAKINAAYAEAVSHSGQPTVILARTIKGYGLGEAGEGRNITHQQKKLNEDEMRLFRDRFEIPISDDELKDAPFKRFDEGSEEFEYLIERRRALGGFVPQRRVRAKPLAAPPIDLFQEFFEGSGERDVATTMAMMRILARLLKDKDWGQLLVPIVPDEARTFGMESLFRTCGIYAHKGQLYEPVDAHLLMRYEERKNGQILEEGITEAGSMASFTAAGTAYATHGLNTLPFFIFYSMFGFQRIGDMIWAAADARCRGFLVGGTAGRTTLNGEGLQHQDGHTHLMASTVPNCIAYDPAYAYELAVIVQDGIRRMYEKGEPVFYYITVYNETYPMPPLPEGVREGIIRGMYKLRAADGSDAGDQGSGAKKSDGAAKRRSDEGKSKTKARGDEREVLRIHLFGSGPLLREALRAQEILRDRFGVAADVWSVTSYNELYRDGLAVERWNRLHPLDEPRKPYVTQVLENEPWPIIATSDYLKSLPQRLAAWVPSRMTCLGTTGFGRSDTRQALRRHFEVDAEHVAFAALVELANDGKFERAKLREAAAELKIDPDYPNPASA